MTSHRQRLRHLPKILMLVFWASIFVSFVIYQQSTGKDTFDVLRDLHQFFTQTPYGPMLYITVYIFRPLILFPATLLTIISGILFGFWGGAAYTLIGENASASFAYAMGRFLGKDMFPIEGGSLLSRLKRRLHKNAFFTLLVMRLSFLSFDFINYLSGIMHLRYKDYVIATAIGITPGMLAFVAMGSSIDNIESLDITKLTLEPSMLALSAMFLAIGVLLMLYFNRKEKKKLLVA